MIETMLFSDRCNQSALCLTDPLMVLAVVVTVLAVMHLSACSDEDRKSASTSTESDETPSEQEKPAKDIPVDLPPPLELGMQIDGARPPLTAGCQAHHYAERLSLQHLRLRCMTTRPLPGSVVGKQRFVEIGFLEYEDAPPRLAYYIEEWHVPRHAGPFTWLHVLIGERHRLGIPQISLRPGRAAWQGKGRGGGNTTAELRQWAKGAKAVVSLAFRDSDLSAQLH